MSAAHAGGSSLGDRIDALEQCFDGDAAGYDENRFGGRTGRLYCRAHQRAVTELLQSRREFPPGYRVLDLATGTGRTAVQLAASGVDVVGLDLSAEMLRVAVAKAGGARRPVFLRGDAFSLPFANRSFDAVVCCRLLQMIPREHYLRFGGEVGRVLKPGGTLVVELWNRRYRRLRTLGGNRANTWGMADTYVTPGEQWQLLGHGLVWAGSIGVGYPLVLRWLGRVSEGWGLWLYGRLGSHWPTRSFGETLLAKYWNRR